MGSRNRLEVLLEVNAAFILELLAGIFFAIAAVPLLLLAARNQQVPERILGITFLLMGVSYLFYETPYALENEALLVPFSLVGRLLWNASVVTTAAFTRVVFHRDQRWAGLLVRGVVVLLFAGLAISAHQGDLEGMAPIGNPGFWLEWVGQVIPFAWVAADALAQYSSARQPGTPPRNLWPKTNAPPQANPEDSPASSRLARRTRASSGLR